MELDSAHTFTRKYQSKTHRNKKKQVDKKTQKKTTKKTEKTKKTKNTEHTFSFKRIYLLPGTLLGQEFKSIVKMLNYLCYPRFLFTSKCGFYVQEAYWSKSRPRMVIYVHALYPKFEA